MSHARVLAAGVSLILALSNSHLLGQNPNSPEGKWECQVEEGDRHTKTALEIAPTGPGKWKFKRTVIETNNPDLTFLRGKTAEGIIDAEGANHYSTVVYGDPVLPNQFTTLDATGLHFKFGMLKAEVKADPLYGDCIRVNAFQSSGPPGTASTAEVPSPAFTPSAAGPTPSTPPDQSLGKLLRDGLEGEQAPRVQCGDREIIVTVFGYFEYDREVDLAKGSKILSLKFQPFSSGAGKSQVSIKPTMKIAAQSINIDPPDQPERPLSGPVHWDWTLDQRFWSSVQESNAIIAIEIRDPNQIQGPDLPLNVKGKPWWWLASWVWDNVLAKPEVSFALLVFIVITWKHGPKKGLEWLWLRIKRVGSGGK